MCYTLVLVCSSEMSEDQLKSFLEAVKADSGLQQQLKDVKDSDSALAIAKEAGFTITTDDLKNQVRQTTELSDEELEGVAGGTMCSASTNGCEGAFEIIVSALAVLGDGC